MGIRCACSAYSTYYLDKKGRWKRLIKHIGTTDSTPEPAIAENR